MVSAGLLLIGDQGRWPAAWTVALGRLGPVVLAVLAAILVLRALLRQGRYRARGRLTETDRESVRAVLGRA